MDNYNEGSGTNFGRSAIYEENSTYLLNGSYDRTTERGRSAAQRRGSPAYDGYEEQNLKNSSVRTYKSSTAASRNSAARNAAKARKRRRRQIRRIIATVLVILLLIILLAGLAAAGYYFRLRSLEGTWSYKEDLTDEVAINAALWLSDVDNYEVDSEWVRAHCDNMLVDVDFTLAYDGVNSGSYSESVDETTYNECAELANKALASCLEDIIISKLELAGYSESITEADIDAAASDTFGMPLTEYLKQMDVTLLPTFDELNDKHSANGSFVAGLSSISFTGSSSETEEYVRSKDTLIFKNSMRIYERKVSE